jgi:segregation and condensation protein B
MTESINRHLPRSSLADEGMSQGNEPAAISLDDLRKAFENAMDLAGPVTPEEPNGDKPGVGGDMPTTPASIIEAILFVGSPTQSRLSMSVFEHILQGMSAADIEKTVSELNESYRQYGHPWQIVCEGDSWSMQLIESVELAVERLQTTPRDTSLSQISIDCLSMIAYRPGISKAELEALWGQNAGVTLNYVIKRGLVRVTQSPESREPCYFTTDRFLEILGLRSLDDLPQGDEL